MKNSRKNLFAAISAAAAFTAVTLGGILWYKAHH